MDPRRRVFRALSIALRMDGRGPGPADARRTTHAKNVQTDALSGFESSTAAAS